jgi:hypothetical protein
MKVKYKNRGMKNKVEDEFITSISEYKNKIGLYVINAKDPKVLQSICKELEFDYFESNTTAFIGKTIGNNGIDLFEIARRQMGWTNGPLCTFKKIILEYKKISNIKEIEDKKVDDEIRKYILDNFTITLIAFDNIDVIIREEKLKINKLSPCLSSKFDFKDISDEDSKSFINLVFSKIKKAKQKSDLDSDSVYKNLSILTKNRMNAEKYPQINFLISK